MSAQQIDVTVLVPVFDEQASVGELVSSIDSELTSTSRSYEILFVDDGSSDGTYDRLVVLAEQYPALRTIRLRRNFGQTAAIAAGLDDSSGRFVVTMDGDLQNDPTDIPHILEVLDEGFDVVSGWRRDRKDSFFTRRLPSLVANRFLARLTGVPIHDFGCTLKGYRASFVKRLPLYSEMHRYIPALAYSVGGRVTEVTVQHHPRQHGYSKYGINRTFRVIYDLVALRMLTRFAARPLHWFGVWSLPCFVASVLLMPLTFVDTSRGQLVSFSTMIFPTIVMLLIYLGVYFLMLGLLAELALNVLRASPRYVYRLDDFGGRTT